MDNLEGSIELQTANDVKRRSAEARQAAIAGRPLDLTYMEYELLRYLFQEAVTGSVNEYARLKREFAPDFLAILTEWLTDVSGV